MFSQNYSKKSELSFVKVPYAIDFSAVLLLKKYVILSACKVLKFTIIEVYLESFVI